MNSGKKDLKENQKENHMPDQKERLEALKLAIKVMNLFHLKWWITAGTLLGVTREDNFISWDRDIDIGIPAQYLILWDYLITAFKEEGFTLKNEWKVKEQKISLAFEKGDERLDIYFFFTKGEYSYHYVFGGSRKYGWKKPVAVANVFPKKLFQKLKEIAFKDISVFVPSDPLLYLKTRYGDAWRTPDASYHYFTDCKARQDDFEPIGARE